MRRVDGTPTSVGGIELWMGLSAQALGDPAARHDVARLRLIGRDDEGWHDLGHVFPDGASLGSREWAGCAVQSADGERVTVYYTAAGRAGEARRTWVQRIACATARIGPDGLTGWSDHCEPIAADGELYMPANEEDGVPGLIKAFRDPCVFGEHLLFTGSLAGAASSFNGTVGLAALSPDGWSLRPPLLRADGVNNELERPHVVVHAGLHYLFFSTQAATFDHAVTGPTGLYGFAAAALEGPYEPLNGSGLVFRNPPLQPSQAYSWLVLDDLRVMSFVDQIGSCFGGTIAPELRLELDGASARLSCR